MPLIDISITVSPHTPEWPGDTPFSCGWPWDMSKGSSVNVSAITMSPHVGTHADAPLHVTPNAPGANHLPLSAFYGPVTVVDVSACTTPVTSDALEQLFPTASVAPTRILLKTNRTIAHGTFPDAWPTITANCAKSLTQHGLILLGTDAPSVDDKESKTLDVHHALFSHNAHILENLDLRDISPGEYELYAFPTKFADLDAAPVRAVLIQR